MQISSYPGVGLTGAFCRGHELICQFGYRYLICKPVDKPHDPLLDIPDKTYVTSTTYGEQFLTNRHMWRNHQDVISHIYNYLMNDEYASGRGEQIKLIKEIAVALMQQDLLVIPLESD